MKRVDVCFWHVFVHYVWSASSILEGGYMTRPAHAPPSTAAQTNISPFYAPYEQWAVVKMERTPPRLMLLYQWISVPCRCVNRAVTSRVRFRAVGCRSEVNQSRRLCPSVGVRGQERWAAHAGSVDEVRNTHKASAEGYKIRGHVADPATLHGNVDVEV
jgi:hypothetical protein